MLKSVIVISVTVKLITSDMGWKMFNPAKAASQIKNEYIGYISTTFRFRNQDLQKQLIEELKKTVSKGPYLEIKDTFITGKTIEDMIADDILSPMFNNLEAEKGNFVRLSESNLFTK